MIDDVTDTLIRYGSFATVIAGGTWWLSQQFSKLRTTVAEWMDMHEAKDQHRHEDNIERFVKLETKLDTVISNGKH